MTVLAGPRIGRQRRAPLKEPEPHAWPVVAATVAVVVPIVVATVRALRDGWLAVGDNGNFLVRSRDVLTSNHPLLGTWSSASLNIGEDVNHPGPLLFDLLAIPAKLGDSSGMAVGVALVNVAAVVLTAVFARRAGGVRGALAALAAAAALCWTMGSGLLYDPWNPHVVLLPFLCVLMLVWAMARGDRVALPVAVAVASVVVQTHLSYAVLVPVLCGYGVVRLVLRHRRALVRHAAVAGVVAALCWAQPIADQVAGEGNLAALAGGFGGAEETVGAGLGVRMAADVVAMPPWWARPSFDEAIRTPPGQPPRIDGEPNVGGLPGGGAAGIALVSVVAVLGAAWLVARGRHDDVASAAVAVAAGGLLLATLALVTQPVSPVGLTAHQLRYLWPLSIFATAAALLALLPRRWSLLVPGAAAAVLSLLTLPAYDVQAGPANDRDAIPVVRALSGELDGLEDEGTLLYDTSNLRFAEPWTSAIMALLDERGIEFQVDEPFWIRQLGEGRAADGTADARLFVREGNAALDVPDGSRRVALVEGLDDAEQRELRRLERSLRDLDIELSDDGRAALDAGGLTSFASGTPTAAQLLSTGELAMLARDGLLVVPDDRAEALARYADLRIRWERHTVGVFVAPLG